MNKKNIVTIIVIGLVIFLVVWNYFSSQKNSTALISRDLYNSKGINKDYDALLRYTFAQIGKEMGFDLTLNINKEYKEDNLNIYVINFDSLYQSDRIADMSYVEFLSFTKNNFVALPPNLIIIDRHFLSFLILNCFNEDLAYTQSYNEVIKRDYRYEDEITEFMLTQSAITTYLSIGNYNLFTNNVDPELSIDSLANEIINSEVADTSDKKYFDLFIYYFLPIISHELAHIKYNDKNANGWIDFKQLIKSNLPVYKEELKADSLAFETVSNYLKKYDTANRRFTSLISFCRTMRNMVLTDTYRNFRGIDPENLIVTLEQRQDLSDDELELPFHYMERVERGYENFLPPMSEEEFLIFSEKLRQNGSSIAHRHMFERCKGILGIIEKKIGTRIQFLDQYMNLLSYKGQIDGSIDSLFLDYDGLPSLIIPQSKILYKLSDSLIYKKAINYEKNHIQLFFLKNGGGYLELYGKDDSVSKVTFVFSTRGANDEVDKRSISNIVFFMRFMMNIYKNESEGQRVAIEAYGMLRDERITLPTFEVVADNNVIKFTPMNKSYFVKVEVFPNY